MKHPSTNPRPHWRRKQLAEHWSVSDRQIDRMARDGRLGPPKIYVGRTPLWTDEQREAAERVERNSTA